jgi:hypothetical protein
MRSYPRQVTTGSRGYFENDGSSTDFPHWMKTEPRSDEISRMNRQVEHNPAPWRREELSEVFADLLTLKA